MYNNAIVGFRQVGMNLDMQRNVTVVGNFIGDVVGRGIAWMNSAIDKEACVAYGSYVSSKLGSPSYETTFTDNIAAGCEFAGFVAPGTTCGNSGQTTFRNNVAHSVNGYGAYIYPNPADSTSSCFEANHFAGYKNNDACVVTFARTKKHLANNINCIDNVIGLSLGTAG